jgi:nitrite reductase/ring-hydroxylating ferredoxin subunit
MALTTVAKVGEIPSGGAKQVTVGNKTLALFNVAGAFYAIDNECPHRNAPLAEGQLQGLELECPWHGARFNITSGAVLCPPARQGVKAYSVQVVGDELQIDV